MQESPMIEEFEKIRGEVGKYAKYIFWIRSLLCLSSVFFFYKKNYLALFLLWIVAFPDWQEIADFIKENKIKRV